MPGARTQIRDWIERWTERLYWKGYLVLTILVVLAYVSLSLALTRQINPFIALFLTLSFPLSLLGYHARKSPSAGRLAYLGVGASLGALAGSLLFILVAILLRTARGIPILVPILIFTEALTIVLGAMIGDRMGRRRGYIFPPWT